MKKLFSGWLAVSLLVLVGCAASTPPGVGVWNVEMNTPLGALPATLTLNADGSGMMSADQLGEAPIEGVSSEAMVTHMIAKGHRDVRLLDSPENLPSFISGMTGDGDVVICMGAGSITQWANDLPKQLAELKGESA